MGRQYRFTTTPFLQKWGEHADDIASRENVDTATIHMRVLNFGNPYQRKAKPTKWERKYWKTAKELCYELRIHLQTLELREKNHGDIYSENIIVRNRTYRIPDMKPVDRQKPWLMKEHPDYIAWRSGVMFPEES
jgi:hypothetical protein